MTAHDLAASTCVQYKQQLSSGLCHFPAQGQGLPILLIPTTVWALAISDHSRHDLNVIVGKSDSLGRRPIIKAIVEVDDELVLPALRSSYSVLQPHGSWPLCVCQAPLLLGQLLGQSGRAG